MMLSPSDFIIENLPLIKPDNSLFNSENQSILSNTLATIEVLTILNKPVEDLQTSQVVDAEEIYTVIDDFAQLKFLPTNISIPNKMSQDEPLNYGVYQQQQRAKEDRYQITTLTCGGTFWKYYAVFDGHGGPYMMNSNHAGDICTTQLHLSIEAALNRTDLESEAAVVQTLTDLFVYFDEHLHEINALHGTTCTIILVDQTRARAYQINLGDSRSILFTMDPGETSGKIISETLDHSPDVETETQRIQQAGGFVSMKRIDGMLMVSRSFGDFEFKITKESKYDPILGKLSAVPTIIVTPTTPGMLFIVASDAPFNQFDNQSLVNMFASYYRQDQQNFTDVVAAIGSHVIRQTSDDTTLIFGQI